MQRLIETDYGYRFANVPETGSAPQARQGAGEAVPHSPVSAPDPVPSMVPFALLTIFAPPAVVLGFLWAARQIIDGNRTVIDAGISVAIAAAVLLCMFVRFKN